MLKNFPSLLVAAAALFLGVNGISLAQTAQPVDTVASTATVAPPTHDTGLSAPRIDELMQRHPELIVDLKELVANQMQLQGLVVQADSLSDEELYERISTSATTRSAITAWLQARGYITADDLRKETQQPNEENDRFSLPRSNLRTVAPASQALTQADRMSAFDGSLPTEDTAVRSERRASPPDQALDPIAPRHGALAQPQEGGADDPSPETIRRPAPYNLQALRDLYTQAAQQDGELRRFGSQMFLAPHDKSASASMQPIDVLAGPDYILGAGDTIVINMWGGVSQTYTRTIDSEGKVILPEAGPLVVAGLSMLRAQHSIQVSLQQQFHNAQIDISLGRMRSIRVYVVGDVQRPGAYDLNALSTPLNALFAAGGPTRVGSLRLIQHFRGQQLVGTVDLYDLFLHGLGSKDEHLAPGDTLLVPPAGPQVAVSGAVKRPAIYELRGRQTLSELLSIAGGTTVAAALDHIVIERIQPNQQRETVTVTRGDDSPEAVQQSLANFAVLDGDHVLVDSILPYSGSAVYLEGHVARPGKVAFHEGLQLGDVLHSYADLLPEPAAIGDLVRLVPPDLHAETTQFNVADVLIGNVQIILRPFDTIRIYGRYEVDSPQVTVQGEVLRPGVYPLSSGMTAAQLVTMAGGFRRDALLDSADLTSYSVNNGSKVVSQRSTLAIGAAVAQRNSANDIALKPGDILTIHQISGWNDIGSSVKVNGEVTYPGSYGLQEGERLSSVLRRAGGLRSTAYANGAVLVRLQVRELEQKSREELIREIETTSASARLSPSLSGQDEATLLQAATQQQNEVLERLRNQPASGRLVIHISSDIESWAGTPADIELRSGDVLTIPKTPSFVLVSGQVYNASAITWVPSQTAGWYLRRAGGTNDVANNKEIFVVHANGSVVGRRSGGAFSEHVLSTRLEPGDVIVVPQKIIGGSLLWRNLLTVAQVSSSIAITGAVAGLF